MSSPNTIFIPLPCGPVALDADAYHLGYVTKPQGLMQSPTVLEVFYRVLGETHRFQFLPLNRDTLAEHFDLTIDLIERDGSAKTGEIYGVIQRVDLDQLAYEAHISESTEGSFALSSGTKKDGVIADFLREVSQELLGLLPALWDSASGASNHQVQASSQGLLNLAEYVASSPEEVPLYATNYTVFSGALAAKNSGFLIDRIYDLHRDDEDYQMVALKARVRGAIEGKLIIPKDSPSIFWEEYSYPGLDTGAPESDLPISLQQACGALRDEFLR